MVSKLMSRRIWPLVCLLFLVVCWLGRRTVGSTGRHVEITSAAPLVMILVTHRTGRMGDQQAVVEEEYRRKLIANRQEYADFHGFTLVVKDSRKYVAKDGRTPLNGWARVAAVRETLEEFPETEWFWYLDQDAVIMDPHFSIMRDLVRPDKLETLIQRDVPIVPPDSVIRTLKNGSPESAHFILSQDHSGLNTKSFLLRQGDFAKYLLEAWSEPLYRSYGFDRHEVAALEHAIQWHYTILSRSALVPKKVLASYNAAAEDMAYKEGDFVVILDGCRDVGRNCVLEFDRYWTSRGRTPGSVTATEHGGLDDSTNGVPLHGPGKAKRREGVV